MPQSLSQLTKQLAGTRAEGLYVLLGDNVVDREQGLRLIAQSMVADGVEPPRTVLYGDEASADDIAVAVGTGSLFGDDRLVIVNTFDRLAASEQEQLAALVAEPPAGVCVVLVADALDRRRRATRALLEAGRVFTFASPKAGGLTRWVHDKARALGLSLPPPAVHALIELVGPDPQSLHTEMEKLAVYTGGHPVDADTVRQVASIAIRHAQERAIFSFTEAVARGETRRALIELQDMLAVGEVPLVILTMIGRQYRLILTACGVSSGNRQQLARVLKLPPFVAGRVAEQARRLGATGARRALALVSDTDLAIKKGLDPRLALETLVVTLTQIKREKADLSPLGGR